MKNYSHHTRKEKENQNLRVCSFDRITIGVLTLLCAAGTAYGVLLDANKKKKQKYDLQEKPVIKTNGHVNGGFINEKTADIQDGGHVNGGLTNGNIGNGNGGIILSYPNSAFSNNIDVVNRKSQSSRPMAT